MALGQVINLPVCIQILAVSEFFISKKDTLRLWSIYLLPVTMALLFIGLLLPDGASIQNQLSYWSLGHSSVGV